MCSAIIMESRDSQHQLLNFGDKLDVIFLLFFGGLVAR